ncbi:uncharacterized protein FRV6_10276 [Fusarium oxysporum]|uniref:Uncharacterized protein n=1 Tax=Fusarium oxysporum TaxID=5507 RepID=A0A2H3TW47_FUSOX|nr:uncharacterized protein FRV6_10276 [Fusarium oxysporum]
MSKWKSTVSEINSRGGFCGETFLLWSHRNDHLTDHFREGSLVKDWKGCRGLDPVVALFVENAIPPYLIGTEAKDADPFSASKGNTKTGSANRGSSVAPTAYGALTADLGDYVRTMRSPGVDVTDDALRQQSRLILYGDDDPWNQTPADNNQWLDMFKAGWGLGHDPLQQQATADRTSNVCASSQSFNTNSCSPFTAESIQHAVGFDPAMMQFELNLDVGLGNDPSPVLDTAFTIPWSW